MRDVAGLRLTFHLAGINNQNFLMRDEQTGSFWQQISGLAISGPMKGRQLTLVPSDELTLATWKSEQPHGAVLDDIPKYAGKYAKKDWDVRMKKVATVIDFPERGMKARDLMLGVQAFGVSRAYFYDQVIKEKLVTDRVGAEPVILAVGADGESVRMFRNDRLADFYRLDTGLMMDSKTGSEWNFQGCAISGKAKGLCLERIPIIKDYWFDWRNYNPKTTIYGKPGER